MPATARTITPDDIMDMAEYAKIRRQRRADMVARKRLRRLAIGPHATMHFENFDTMLYQVHEMIHTEQGGADQIPDELAAYNPLVPQGNELVATLMLEVEDPVQRAAFLARLGGVEEHIHLSVGDHVVPADWEQDVERTTPDGKTSSVHFLHFRLPPEAAAAFRTPGTRVTMAIEHPAYGHVAIMPEEIRAELAGDL